MRKAFVHLLQPFVPIHPSHHLNVTGWSEFNLISEKPTQTFLTITATTTTPKVGPTITATSIGIIIVAFFITTWACYKFFRICLKFRFRSWFFGMITLWTEIISVLKRKGGRRTSTPVAPPRNDQPSCWKNSKGFSLICFMMGPQFKLTGPSLIGISTELSYQVSVLYRIEQ